MRASCFVWQIHFHSALLLVAFYSLHILGGLLSQFGYKVFKFKKLLSDFCWDNHLLYFWDCWDYRFSDRSDLSVLYDLLMNCPTLRQDVPSSWPLDMGTRWEESPGFNGDGHNWGKDYSCSFLLCRMLRVVSIPLFLHKKQRFADEQAHEEEGDLQLDSPLLPTSLIPRLRICRCGRHQGFQKLLMLLRASCAAAGLA